jgi:hypothetical protein
MARAVSLRTVWDREAIAALKTDPEVQALVEFEAQALAAMMRATSPKRTGAGAASIMPRPSRSKGARDVGWDKAHYYLTILNGYSTLGEAHRPNVAYQFVEDALNRHIHV